MGYQESWVVVSPQRKFGLLLKAYHNADKAGFYKDVCRPCAEPLSIIELKQKIASIPQGTKILWACGERSATNINGIFQGELKQRFNMKIDILPIEHIMGLYNKDMFEGINFNSEKPTENEFFKRYSIKDYISKYDSEIIEEDELEME